MDERFDASYEGQIVRVVRADGDWRVLQPPSLRGTILADEEIELLYTTRQVGRLYDRSRKTVGAWIRRRRLAALKVPATRGQGGSWRIPESALEEFELPKRGRKYMWERIDDEDV